MISKALLLFCLLAAAAFGGGAAAAYNATDLFLFNCGASSGKPDRSGRTWNAEDRRLLSANSDNASFTSTASVQDPSVEQVPYMTARIFRSDFTYSFPVSPGWKFLRLYFYPTRYGSDLDAVNSFFAVTANGFSLLRNFSAYLTARGSVPPSESLIKEFIVPVLDGQTLNLTFTSLPNSLAFVNGVEIVSMPDRFYTKGGFDDVITNVDSTVTYEIANTTAFETVHRVNVGGPAISDVGDTGMFRRWVTEEGFLLGVSGVTPYLDVQINYTAKTPAYVAPEDVYTTYRTMGMATSENPRLNVNFNLTWLFTVDVGFSYLLRLHFCETMQEVTRPGQRIFSIFIANRRVVPDADVIFWSGGSKIPVYKDFATLVASNRGEKRRDLRLDLHPFMDVDPQYADAILNGVEILKLSNSEGSLAGPNPEPVTSSGREPRPSSSRRGKGRSRVLAIVLAVVGCVLGLITTMVVAVLFTRRRKRQRETTDNSSQTTSKPKDSWGPVSYTTVSTTTKSASSLPSDLCRRFSIVEIRSATDDFDPKLIIGVGAFGNVYKGRIDRGSTLVAIKRLGTSSHQGVKEFETELEMLSRLRHIHLVSLIGYCDDENEMVLVYEYMPRGTLRDNLYKKEKDSEPPLPWKQRLEICIGAARGVQYLHNGAKQPIIHRDIKSTNILIEENYVAKVSDFGLSKVGPMSVSQTHVTTVVKGSVGYLDPEYYRRQLLTDKSDVYSFGVVLFEVLCGRPVRVPGLDADQVDLTRWAKLNHSRGTVDQIVDPHLKADITRVSLYKFCEIAVRCVHDRGTERPTMNDVVWALEFALQLHETATKNGNVDELELIKMEKTNYNSPRGEMDKTNEGDDLFSSRTTGHASGSTPTDDRSLMKYEGTTGSSSDAVFSEIRDPKAR